jgi:hypothetical protein
MRLPTYWQFGDRYNALKSIPIRGKSCFLLSHRKPSKFELAEDGTSVCVVVDVNNVMNIYKHIHRFVILKAFRQEL